MHNPYKAPEAKGPVQPGDWSTLKRILAIPIACVSMVFGMASLLAIAGIVISLVQGDNPGQLFGSLVGLVLYAGLCAGAFFLARALWDPKKYSRAAIDQADLRAIYAHERLDQLPTGEVGIYGQTQDGELVRLHARVLPDRLPERHRELLARIKERVEQLDAAEG